ncbi:uncharacterized protein LOC117215809 [Bombus bifarius]|uniref:Uncharacterized protein LOC117215809 n=1 Tax=Bombus bifarius TaxID=103933 RepID=A0A6P8MW83_9HYME|nr:uncharacterized protein LOC117215809 [Bombus bifarius]
MIPEQHQVKELNFAWDPIQTYSDGPQSSPWPGVLGFPHVNKKKEEINFSIKQFDGTQKVTDWISEYEEECRKYKIKSDEEKVKGLKKYLEKTAAKWYQTNLLKAEGYNWEDWKDAFLKTFNNKGWYAIRYAYNCKYASGSFIEYALEKERLMLEVKRKMAEDVRIHLIVIGLPIDIQDKIEREIVQSTNDLMGILGQYEDQRKRKETQEKKVNLDKNANPPSKKRPCTVCEALNFPGRFHPVELCRNRSRNAQKKPKQVNSLELFSQCSLRSERNYVAKENIS